MADQISDLKNIRLTVEADHAVGELKKKLGLTDQMDLIRLGFAYGIKNGLSLDRDSLFGSGVGSNYSTGGLDPEGLMAESVKIYHQDETVEVMPYRAVETVMNKGIRLLFDHLQQGEIGSVGDLFEPH